MPTIHVVDRAGNEHTLRADTGQSVMEPLRELDDGVEALCGGMCSCATCHVFIESEWFVQLAERQDDELELLEDTECFQENNSRLACQIEMTDQLDGLRLTVAPEE